MKKQVINFSWPATLSFSADNGNENERFSRGKLEVFYKGETADKRFFSDEFSEELVKSLPYTPIVSHYDEEKDDFVGHATQQDIYGIVDPCGEISFVTKEDGNTWCVCDTVYYTERPDKVGEIAKKIEGHSQSLELDPSTVKYNINYDERRHFKNVEFTAGKFIGVSVLGKDQKPAFTGSSFFSCDDFDAKMKILRDYCESHQDRTDGGNEMNLQEFMKLSWGDISVKVEEAITAEYQEEAYTYVVDMFEDSAIVRFYSYIDGSTKLMRVKYSCDENGAITLGTVNEVHISYEDIPAAIEETGVEQATVMSSIEEPVTETSEEEIVVEEPIQAEEIEQPTIEETFETPVVAETPVEETSESAPVVEENVVHEEPTTVVDETFTEEVSEAPVTNAEVTETTEKVSVDNEQIEEENSSTTSFAESERAEFETLKREKKVTLLDSYKEYLTDEEYADFTSRIDTFEVDTLEVELLKKYKSHTERTPQKTMRAFALFAPKTESAINGLDAFVRKNLNR